ncbi:MAG TPA: hypothetical protein VFP88_02620 [Rhodanobacteraceae bacterium]|nr:hypothetical protein [Rhodanobacteraceae bacterium]
MTASAPAPLPPDAPWIVLKFGGTSVATPERWRTILELAAARRAEGARVLVVVSALSGVTDALKALCTCAPEASVRSPCRRCTSSTARWSRRCGCLKSKRWNAGWSRTRAVGAGGRAA